MATKTGFHVDRRVSIAADALSPQQKSIIDPLLSDEHRFLLRTNRTGMTKKLPNRATTYALNAGGDLRIIYSKTSDGIIVQDIMRESTLRQFVAKAKPAKIAPTAPAAMKAPAAPKAQAEKKAPTAKKTPKLQEV